MGNLVTGNLGAERLVLDLDKGLLTIGGVDIIWTRDRLISRLFGSIMEVPFMPSLVKRVGIDAGALFARDWLLKITPTTLAHNRLELPGELRTKSERYFQLQAQIEGQIAHVPVDPAVLNEERKLTAEVKAGLRAWLDNLPASDIRDMWERMHEFDAFSGWGHAHVSTFDRVPDEPDRSSATIQLVNSFIARQSSYWAQSKFAGQPVCFYLAGYFLGEAQVLLGNEKLSCEERRCLCDGSDVCEFVIKPPNTASAEIREALPRGDG